MKIRAAVLEATHGLHHMQELDLAPPGPGEVLVRLGASGVCRSDYNAIDGTTESPCPVVLGHEGAGVVEAVGPGVTRVVPGDHVALSWTPSCGECGECVRGLPQLCATVWPTMDLAGLMDGTSRLSRDGERVYHYCFLSTFAEATVVPERSCVPIPKDVPMEVAALVGCAITTGVGAVWKTAGVRPGDRVAVIGCGGVGLSAMLAAVAVGRRAGDRRRHDAGARRRGAGVRRDGRGRLGWELPRRRPRRCARSPAAVSTTRSRRPGAARRCRPPCSRPATAAPPC